MELDRLFIELTPEVDYTSQMYAKGLEKKEIANLKCRAIVTINNQIQKAFEVLEVRNGRELSILYAERITKSIIAIFLLAILSVDIYYETTSIYRKAERTELVARRRVRRQDDILDYEPILT
jgi:DNA-binding NarL/FixJ family response regulator